VSCHTGRRSCFYRILQTGDRGLSLVFDETVPKT
jgi:hypothetical protein